MYEDKWLEEIFKGNTISRIEYSEDGTVITFYFVGDTKLTIRHGYNGLEVSFKDL